MVAIIIWCILISNLQSCTEPNRDIIVEMELRHLDSCEYFCDQVVVKLINNSNNDYYLPLFHSTKYLKVVDNNELDCRNNYVDEKYNYIRLNIQKVSKSEFERGKYEDGYIDFFDYTQSEFYQVMKEKMVNKEVELFLERNNIDTNSIDIGYFKDIVDFRYEDPLYIKSKQKVSITFDVTCLVEKNEQYTFQFDYSSSFYDDFGEFQMNLPLKNSTDSINVVVFNNFFETIEGGYNLFHGRVKSNKVYINPPR